MGRTPLYKDILFAGYYCCHHNNEVDEMRFEQHHDSFALTHDDHDDDDDEDEDDAIERSVFLPSEQALLEASVAMGRFPADLCTDELMKLKQYYTNEETEWIMLSLCFLGSANFLAKTIAWHPPEPQPTPFFAVSTRWEAGTNTPHGYDLTTANTTTRMRMSETLCAGSSTTLHDSTSSLPNHVSEVNRTYPHHDPEQEYAHDEQIVAILKVIKKCPKVMVQTMMVEPNYKAGVTGDLRKAGLYLKEHTGYAFPLLKSFEEKRCRTIVIAMTAVLRDQFDRTKCHLARITKALCTVIFAGHINDEHLQEDASQMITVFAKQDKDQQQHHPNSRTKTIKTIPLVDAMLELGEEPVPVTPDECRAVLQRLEQVPGVTSAKMAAILLLTRAAVEQPQPAISPLIVQEIITPHGITPSEISELFFWLSLQIIFHRHHRYYEVKNNTPADCWDDAKVRNRQHEQEEQHQNRLTGIQSERLPAPRSHNHRDISTKSDSDLLQNMDDSFSRNASMSNRKSLKRQLKKGMSRLSLMSTRKSSTN